MSLRALDEFKSLPPNYTLTPDTVNNLGGLYPNQGQLAEVE